MERKKNAIKKLVFMLVGALIIVVFLNSTISDFEESKLDIKAKIGEKINGGELSVSEYIMLCEKTLGIYLSAGSSGDFNTTYALLTPEYREVISFEDYVESVKDIEFDTAYIEKIDILTTNLYQANVVYSGDITQEYLILLEEKGYSIVPDKFLMNKDLNAETNKKGVLYQLVSYEVYTDRCIFNCIITNNRKEDVLITKATMLDERGVDLESNVDYTIKPGESKKISISIDSNIFIPTVFELTRETDEKYMMYQFEL